MKKFSTLVVLVVLAALCPRESQADEWPEIIVPPIHKWDPPPCEDEYEPNDIWNRDSHFVYISGWDDKPFHADLDCLRLSEASDFDWFYMRLEEGDRLRVNAKIEEVGDLRHSVATVRIYAGVADEIGEYYSCGAIFVEPGELGCPDLVAPGNMNVYIGVWTGSSDEWYPGWEPARYNLTVDVR